MPISASSIINGEVRGFAGSQGATGFAGSQGDLGYTGSQGTTGFVGSQGELGYTGSRGKSEYTVSNIAPVTPLVGDRWLDSTTGTEYTYVNDGDGNLWVELGSVTSVSAVNGLLNSNISFGTDSSTAVTFNSQITGNLIPSQNEVYSIGSATNRWANIYLAANTINLGTVALSASGGTLVLPGNLNIGSASLNSADGQLVLPANVKIGNAFIDGTSGGTVSTSVAAAGAVPKVASIAYPGDDTAADTAGGQTITLTGSGFQAGAAVIIDGAAVGVVTVVSSTTLTFTAPAKAAGSYLIYVINTDGGTAVAVPGIQYSGTPAWSTAAGNIASQTETTAFSNTVTATGDAPITYTLQSGTLPPGSTLNGNGTITGTSQLTGSPTTYTFTVRATDAQNQDTDRSFSITVNPDVVTWSSPADNTSYEIANSTAISNVSLVATSAAGSAIAYTANALPTGISISGNVITGTPTGYSSQTTVATQLTANATATTRTAVRTISWTITVGDAFFRQTTTLLQADTTTFITDASTNNFLITRNGDTRPSRLSPYWPGGWSAYFDGTGDYLSLADSSAWTLGTNNFTIEFWIYFVASDGSIQNIAGQSGSTGDYSNQSFVFYRDANNKINGYVVSGGATAYTCTSTASVTQNTWRHVALVRNNNTLTLYIDGSANSTANLTGVTITNSSSALSIGRVGDYATSPVNGYISNFRLVNGTAAYTANFTPSTISLTTVANTSLLTLRDSTLADESPYNLAITRNGDTKLTTFSPFNTAPHTIAANTNSVYFDGTGDYLGVSNTTDFEFGAGNFTIEFWICYIAAPSSAIGYEYWQPQNHVLGYKRLSIYGFSNEIYVGWNGTNVLATSGLTWNAGTWYHLAFTRNGNSWNIYRNGNLQVTATNTNTLDAASGYNIGLNQNALISNFRVVKGTAVYTANFTPATSSLTAISGTSLLTCQANTIIDSNTTPKTITVNGNPNVSLANPFGETVTTISNYTWTANSYGASAYFDGTGDTITIADSANLEPTTQDFSIEFWIYPTVTTDFYMYGKGDVATAAGSTFSVTRETSTLYIGSTSYTLATTGLVKSFQWNHYVFCRESSNLSVFINGIRAATNSSLGNGSANNTAEPLVIGGYFKSGGNTGTPVTGYMADFRYVIGRSLYSATSTSFIPPTAPLANVANVSLLTLQSDIGSNSAQFLDQSPNNHLITRNGNASQGSYSPLNPTSWSAYFDGTGDALSVTRNTSFLPGANEDFTFEAWVYLISTPGAQGAHIMGFTEYGTDGDWVLGINSSRQLFFYMTSTFGTYLNTGTLVNLNEWTHVAVSRSGTGSNNLKLFVNGFGQGHSVNNTTVGTGNRNLSIGADQDSDESNLSGYISNLRMIKGTGLYTANFTPSTTTISPVANTSLLTLRGPAFTDDSSNDFAITRNGDTKIVPFGPFNPHTITPNSYSVYFDGTGDYLSIPTNAEFTLGAGDFTIEVWIYAASITNTYGRTIAATYSYVSSLNRGWILNLSSTGYPQFELYNSSGVQQFAILSSVITPTNQWTHLAAVRSSSSVKLYLNGTQVGSATSSADDTVQVSDFTIGTHRSDNLTPATGNSGTSFLGYISNLRIVKGTALYTANFTPATSALTTIANTSLLACQANTIIDGNTTPKTVTVNGDARPRKLNPFGETVTSGVAYAPATHGGSAYFDGTGDFIVPANDPAWIMPRSFTIECWIYPTSLPTIGGIFSTRNSASSSYGVSIALVASDSKIWVEISNTNTNNLTLKTTGTVVLNQWQHLAIVSTNGTTLQFYLNGQLQASGSTTQTPAYSSAVIGRYYTDVDNYYFQGYISNIRTLKGTALYTSNFVPPTSPGLPTTANTSLLLNFTNSSIYDATGRLVYESVGDTRVANSIKKFGSGSLYFDGSDRLVAPANAISSLALGDFTIEMWVYASAVNSTQVLFQRAANSYATASDLQVGMFIGSTGQIQMRPYVSTTDYTTNIGAISANTWTHVAMVRSGGTFMGFVNGVRSANTIDSIASTTSLNDNATWPSYVLGYGLLNSTTDAPFTGYLADLRITKGVARFTANFTPSSSASLTK